jgi:DNA polymerase III subunit delta
MPTATEHAFQKTIAAGAFAPVYYLWGDDDFRKTEAVGRAVDAVVDGSLRDFNVEVHQSGELDAETLESVLGTPPMMADRRAVVVRDVAALKKDARRALDRYLERPASDTIVFLVAAAGGKSDETLRGRAIAVEFPELTGDRLPKWIAHRASAQHATITPEASALLQQAAGPELAALASEVDKLVSYARGAAGEGSGESPDGSSVIIDEDAVAAVVGVRRGETMSDLLDRIAARDATGALVLIEHVLAQPKTTAVSVVMALSVQTLAMAWGRARRDEGVPSGRLAGEYFTLLKETGANPMRPWGEAIATWVGAVDRWSASALDRALDALLMADVALKDTRVSTDEQVIASLVLAMCAGGEPGHVGARSSRAPRREPPHDGPPRTAPRGVRQGVSA